MNILLSLAFLLMAQLTSESKSSSPNTGTKAKKAATVPTTQSDIKKSGTQKKQATKQTKADAGNTNAKKSGEAGNKDEEEDDSGTSLADLWDEISATGALGYLNEGGFFMYPILIMGIIACGVIIERFRSLHLLASDGAEIRTQVRQLLQEDRIEEALELCDSAEGPVAAILAAGVRKFLLLRRLDYDAARIEEQVVKAMEDYSVHVVSALEKHLPILATISSVAPMMGFLGTVAGMITSFKQIVAKMGEMNIVESAAGGISVALLTTAFGLIIGIPAFMFFNYFSGVINRFVLEVEESATELIEVVTLHLALERKEAEAGVPKSSGAEITEFGSDDDEEPSPETEEELSRR